MSELGALVAAGGAKGDAAGVARARVAALLSEQVREARLALAL